MNFWNLFGEVLIVAAVVLVGAALHNVVKFGAAAPRRCEACGGAMYRVANGTWNCPNWKATFPDGQQRHSNPPDR